MFTNIEEAASFWRSLWEAEGTGDTGAEWLAEVRCAIREKVPEPTEEIFALSEASAAKVIGKKRNWSAPGQIIGGKKRNACMRESQFRSRR